MLWEIPNTNLEYFGKYHYSKLVEKEMLVNSIRLVCTEKERLYLDKGEAACSRVSNLWPAGHIQLITAVNVAQNKIISLLKTS